MVPAEEWIQILNLLVYLAMGHCVADYPLQTDRIAIEKCPGCDTTLNWRWWLAAHAGVHAFFVVLITGIPLLGVGEWILHIIIDYGKCQKRYNLAVDQSLHLACKALWAFLALVVFQ
ncbi:MAG: DUF3307 domain-containing protein [Cyanobium sp.]